jgi:hypothetical protein
MAEQPAPGGRIPALTDEEVREAFFKGSTERYRRYAAELLPRLAADMLRADTGEERANARWLTGELLRRLGRFDEAKERFETFAAEIGADHKFSRLVAFQLRLIAASDASVYMMSEASGKPSRLR